MVQRELSQLEKLGESFGALSCGRAVCTAHWSIGWRGTRRSSFYLIQPFLRSLRSSGHAELLMYSRYINHGGRATTAQRSFGRVSALYKSNLLISAFGAILYSH